MTMNPDVSLLQLAEHEGALRRLARCLTTDPEDLEQETRLRWWQEGGGVRDVGAWLGTVMRNLAHNNRRGAQRRGRREQEVAKNADAAVPSPEDLVARSEVFALLVGVVNELPEARRQVTVLVFFEGLEVREAAARLGLSVARVYELRRLALDDLRGRLDARHGRETWMGMLVPLAGGREVAGVGASTGKSALTGANGTGAGVLGALVIVMKTKTAAIGVSLLGVLILLIYGASLVEWLPGSVPVAVNPASATTDAREAGRGDPEDRVATPHDRMERTAVVTRDEILAYGTLVVKVCWNDGAPAPAVMVIATRDGDNLGTQGVRRNAGQQGVARFERLPVGKYTVRSNRACGYESATVEAGMESMLEMTLNLGIDVTGIVRKPDGGPADNAQIEVVDTLVDDWYGPLPVCRTDGNGYFVARALSQMISLVARSADFSASEVATLHARVGDVRHIELILGEPGGKLEGRVLDQVGRPVEDATVMIGIERHHSGEATCSSEPNRGW